jgi:hypothetical protein
MKRETTWGGELPQHRLFTLSIAHALSPEKFPSNDVN